MLKITTKDYPGEYFVQSECSSRVSFFRTLSGAEFHGCTNGRLKIIGSKILLSGEEVGRFKQVLWTFTNYFEFNVCERNYRIVGYVGTHKLSLECNNEPIAEIDFSSHEMILFQEKYGWAEIKPLFKGHDIALLVSLYSLEKRIRPSENG
ncbi:hypothetical protein R50072_14640 [Simiduia litorea]|uniref:hypothetical protein n=1 Tax=Simiduia litorea TaxID=1435348 RepID=UPI0036F37621